MKQYNDEYKGAGSQGGWVYEHVQTGERVISGKPTKRGLPGKPADWKSAGRER